VHGCTSIYWSIIHVCLHRTRSIIDRDKQMRSTTKDKKMIKKIIITSCFMAVSIFTLSTTTNVGNAQGFTRIPLPAKICKTRTSETGWWKTRRFAAYKAKINWSRKVSSTYGRAYASWGKSSRKRVRCVHDRIDNGYRCLARATPCFVNGVVIGS
jgi:hypothetical protein